MRPQLITLEGDFDIENVLMGIDAIDLPIINNLTNRNIRYLNWKYPEYMGFWGLIAKGAKKIGQAAIKGIGKRIAKRRAKKKKSTAKPVQPVQPVINKQAEIQRAAIIRAQLLQQAAAVNKQKQDDQTKKLIVVGSVFSAGLLLILLTRNNK